MEVDVAAGQQTIDDIKNNLYTLIKSKLREDQPANVLDTRPKVGGQVLTEEAVANNDIAYNLYCRKMYLDSNPTIYKVVIDQDGIRFVPVRLDMDQRTFTDILAAEPLSFTQDVINSFYGFGDNAAIAEPANPEVNINIICFGKEFYYYMCYIRFLFGSSTSINVQNSLGHIITINAFNENGNPTMVQITVPGINAAGQPIVVPVTNAAGEPILIPVNAVSVGQNIIVAPGEEPVRVTSLSNINNETTYNINLYCDNDTYNFWNTNIGTPNYILRVAEPYTPTNNFIALLAETFPNGAEDNRRRVYTNDPFLNQNVHIRIVTSSHYLMSTIGYKRGLINFMSGYMFNYNYSKTIDDNISGIYNNIAVCNHRNCLQEKQCLQVPVGQEQIEISADKLVLMNQQSISIIDLYDRLKRQVPNSIMIGIIKGQAMHMNTAGRVIEGSCAIYKLVLFNNTNLKNLKIIYNPFAISFLEDMMFNLSVKEAPVKGMGGFVNKKKQKEEQISNCKVDGHFFLRFAHNNIDDNEDCFNVTISTLPYKFNKHSMFLMYICSKIISDTILNADASEPIYYYKKKENLLGQFNTESKYRKFHFILFMCLFIQKFFPNNQPLVLNNSSSCVGLSDCSKFLVTFYEFIKNSILVVDDRQDNSISISVAPEFYQKILIVLKGEYDEIQAEFRTQPILEQPHVYSYVTQLYNINREALFEKSVMHIHNKLPITTIADLYEYYLLIKHMPEAQRIILKFTIPDEDHDQNKIIIREGQIYPRLNLDLHEGTLLHNLHLATTISRKRERYRSPYEEYLDAQYADPAEEGTKKRKGGREKYLKYLNKYLFSINPNHKLLTELDIDMNENVNEKYLEYNHFFSGKDDPRKDIFHKKYLLYKEKYLQIKQNNSNGFVSMINNLLSVFNF